MRSDIANKMMKRSGALTSMQAAAALLLLFAGWGVRNLSAFFASGARAGLVALVVAGAAVAIVWRVDTQPLRKGMRPPGRQSLQLGILLALSLLLLFFLPYADRHHVLQFELSWPRYAGLALCAAGGVVRLLAMRRLGGQFSAYVTLQPGHRLIESGIYASIRHPLYLSLILAPVGIALVFASVLALPIFILALTFVADRIAKEERLLAEGFGAAFTSYRQRTRMLIPYVF